MDETEAKQCFNYFLQNDSMFKKYSDTVLIRNEELAIKIAEPYLFEKFGKSIVESERPYHIAYMDSCWVIEGADNDSEEKGGTFSIILSALDGKVVWIAHGK